MHHRYCLLLLLYLDPIVVNSPWQPVLLGSSLSSDQIGSSFPSDHFQDKTPVCILTAIHTVLPNVLEESILSCHPWLDLTGRADSI